MNNLLLILSSASVAAVVSAIASFIINVIMQKRKYKNDYYKTIINKRLDAYQHIETQIQVLKWSVADNDDTKLYCMMFSGDSEWCLDSQKHIKLALSKSLWLSQNMIDALNQLQKHFFEIENEITDVPENNIEVGKKWYSILGEDRNNIEDCLKNDMLSFHDVESFLETKADRKKVIINIPKHI